MTPVEQERVDRYVQQGYNWIQAKGAKFDLQPQRINLTTLTVNSMDLCVLGQASGRHFADVLFDVYVAKADENSPHWAEEHGFVPFGDEDVVEYINQQWRKLLTQQER